MPTQSNRVTYIRSKLAHFAAVGGLAVWLVAAAQVIDVRPATGRCLPETEMSTLVGDGMCPCMAVVNCSDGIISGLVWCVKCENLSETRKVCCNKGDHTRCKYGSDKACNGLVRKKGMKNGEAGDCGSCTSDDFGEDGNCTTLEHADDQHSDPCP